MSRDPIEEKGGWDLYGFSNNQTLNAIDILGLAKKWNVDISIVTQLPKDSPNLLVVMEPTNWARLWSQTKGIGPNTVSVDQWDTYPGDQSYYDLLLKKIEEAIGKDGCIENIIIRSHGNEARVGLIKVEFLVDPNSVESKFLEA